MDMTYPEMYKQYNLKFNCLNASIIKEFDNEVRTAENKKRDEEKKLVSQNALISFNLNQSEGDELCSYLRCNTTWADFTDTVSDFVNTYTSSLDISAFELLTYFRENEYARNEVYDRNKWDYQDRVIIDQQHRWDTYEEYLMAYYSNPDEIKATILGYEEKKRQEADKKETLMHLW
jgi:hypothetical protein